MMTKQDFEFIARTIRGIGTILSPEEDHAEAMTKRIALHFAEALKNTNPRFDAMRFYRVATKE